MKRFFLVLGVVFLLCGCSSNGLSGSSNSSKVVVKGSMNCVVEDSEFVLELENGQIVKYIDSIDGELSEDTVNILNEEYLVGVTDNDEAIRRMNDGLKDLGGHCE